MFMNSSLLLRKLFLAGVVTVLAMQPARLSAASNVTLWDTGSAYRAGERAAWKVVPSDLLSLEANPPKASSDPGYYGREYIFSGDAVVENNSLLAVFSSAAGKMLFYTKGDHGKEEPRLIFEFTPQTKTAIGAINRCDILRNAGDEVRLNITFGGKNMPEYSVAFAFDKSEVVEIKPTGTVTGMALTTALDYGVAPGFIGDDLIFPGETSSKSIFVPAENAFVGLVKGGNDMLVMTWPAGQQRLSLQLAEGESSKKRIESIAFSNDGQSLFVAALSAPGIWHKEDLNVSFLEKDVALSWKKPFPAKWRTQLSEGGVKTAFAFREAKGTVWRGVPGSYNYPVWFEGDKTWYHLGKKVAPKGESLIYFFEGEGTPPGISTPADIIRSTLGRQMADKVLDPEGRKLRTHHRRGGDGVRRACTCGCTEAIQAVFETGDELSQKQYVDGAVGDMIFFVQRHVERIDEYRKFADEMSKFLRSKQSQSPEVKAYAEALEKIIQQIPQEYEVQKENMKSVEYATDLAKQTVALAGKKDAKNLPAYLELGKAWRAMGGAQDYVVAQCHTVTRRLFQEAGYECANNPKALELAREVRARCKKTLRNPDGYEIWAEY